MMEGVPSENQRSLAFFICILDQMVSSKGYQDLSYASS